MVETRIIVIIMTSLIVYSPCLDLTKNNNSAYIEILIRKVVLWWFFFFLIFK